MPRPAMPSLCCRVSRLVTSEGAALFGVPAGALVWALLAGCGFRRRVGRVGRVAPPGRAAGSRRSACERGCRFGAVRATTGRVPFQRSTTCPVHTPGSLVFQSVVGLAQMGEVVVSSRPVMLPINGVIEVGVGRGTTTPRKATRFVPNAKPELQISRNCVAISTHGKHRTGFGMRQQPHKTRRVCRQAPGDVIGDGTVSLQRCRCCTRGIPLKQAQHGYGDQHRGAHPPTKPRIGGDPIDQQVGKHVGSTLRESARVIR